jgi:ATP-dependent protease ClpP protease subunit
MPIPSKDYRENPKRAIYLTGKIDQQLVDRISPAINQLRLESTDPITVYIDSPGGQIMLAETIRHHLQAPNPDGERCRLITVVTSRAASAAADFAALGDYAIAYPYADLVYHGSRINSDMTLTTEMAATVARSLQQTNENFAVRLARRAFPRFLLRLTQFSDKFKAFSEGADLSVLTDLLKADLSRTNAQLVTSALQRQKFIGDLTMSVGKHLLKFKHRGANFSSLRFEGEMLRAIVNHKSKVHRGDRWLLSETGLQEVSEDFNLLFDFHWGPHRQELEKWYKTYGEIFLSDSERKEYGELGGVDADKDKWLVEKSESKMRPIWYLTISIARLLQKDDYTLPARDAYWLGLVDEVPGSDLPCIRHSAEVDKTT